LRCQLLPCQFDIPVEQLFFLIRRITLVFKGGDGTVYLRFLNCKGGFFCFKLLLLLMQLRLLFLKAVYITVAVALARVIRTDTNKEPSISRAKTTAIILTSFFFRFMLTSQANSSFRRSAATQMNGRN
jgi:hypothetical protein